MSALDEVGALEARVALATAAAAATLVVRVAEARIRKVVEVAKRLAVVRELARRAEGAPIAAAEARAATVLVLERIFRLLELPLPLALESYDELVLNRHTLVVLAEAAIQK